MGDATLKCISRLDKIKYSIVVVAPTIENLPKYLKRD